MQVQLPVPSSTTVSSSSSSLNTSISQSGNVHRKDITADSSELNVGETAFLSDTAVPLSSEQTQPFHSQTPQRQPDISANIQGQLTDESTHSDTGNVPDDSQSVASSSSELELLNDKDTENFLKNLPPFKPLNLSELLPKLTYSAPVTQSAVKEQPDPRMHSPPVKETSFRPVTGVAKSPVSPQDVTQSSGYHSFITDSGVLSPEANIISPQSVQASPQVVIPKPGPLFKSSPLHSTPQARSSKKFSLRD